MTRKDNKITLVKIKFSMNACENLSNKEIENISDTARDFFHFVQRVGDFLKIKDFLNTWMVEDSLQMTETVTCCLFQLYFYENLFNPKTKVKYKTTKKLPKEQLKRTVFFKQRRQ